MSPQLSLSLGQKRQAALLYYWMSPDYLKGLNLMIDKFIDRVDILPDLARSKEYQVPLSGKRKSTHKHRIKNPHYGFPPVIEFKKSTIKLMERWTNEDYCGTSAYNCGRMLGEFYSGWDNEEDRQRFDIQFDALFSYAYRINEVTEKNLRDSSMVRLWEMYGKVFPSLPQFMVHTDIVGKTGKRPPRTGVYVPKDDPYGTLQFAWRGNKDGFLDEVLTFNEAGLAAVGAIGRNALWHDEQKMMDYVIEGLKTKRLQPAHGIGRKDVDSVNAAHLVLSAQVYIKRPCEWYFVEMIDGEFEG